MKIKEGFLLRRVADENVVIPVGPACATFNGIIKLNESSLPLWELLKRGAEEQKLADALQAEYGISAQQAAGDVSAFLASLRKAGCIEE